MGLDAYVACRCYAEGRTPPAPVPVVIDPDTREVVEADWRGGGPGFDQWQAGACPHAREHEDGLMLAADEWLSNWNGVGRFNAALTCYARSLCPNLLGEWVRIGNGGTVAAGDAALMLDELALLEEVPLDVVEVTDDGLFQRVLNATDLGGQWCRLAQGEEFRLEVTDLSGRIEVLRGEAHLAWTNRYQELIEAGRGTLTVPGVATTQLRGDLQYAQSRACTSRAVRTTVAEHHRNIVDALTRLFAASIDTGNPVCWS